MYYSRKAAKWIFPLKAAKGYAIYSLCYIIGHRKSDVRVKHVEQWKNKGLFAKTIYSLNGLYKAFTTEKAIRHETIGVLIAVVLAAVMRCGARDILLVFLYASVPLPVELINTALERMIDTSCGPVYREEVRIQKDILSGAVFLSLMIGYGLCLSVIFLK